MWAFSDNLLAQLKFWTSSDYTSPPIPLIDLFMASRSAADADHVLFAGKPLNGGGPLTLNSVESTPGPLYTPIASTYFGARFRVERVDCRSGV